MDKIKINMNLDPVKDGIEGIENFKEADEYKFFTEKKNKPEAVVISTNGQYKTIDKKEMMEIIFSLEGHMDSVQIGAYGFFFNAEKTFEIEDDTYFVGSILVFRGYEDEDDQINSRDIKYIIQAIRYNLKEIVFNGEKVAAFKVD